MQEVIEERGIAGTNSSPVEGALSGLRRQLVRGILRAVIIFGFLACVAATFDYWSSGQIWAIVVYWAVYGVFVLFSLWPKVPFGVQVWGILILFFVAGAANFVSDGPAGSGRLFVLILPFTASILLGKKEGILTLSVGSLTMIGVGIAFSTNLLTVSTVSENLGTASLSRWIGGALVLFALGMMVVFSVDFVTSRLLMTLDQQRRLAQELEVEIKERQHAEQQRQEHVRFLESLEEVNRAIHLSNDVAEMLNDVLEVVISIFDCDRAWLLFPCDPDAPTYQIPVEITKPAFPGALVIGEDIPMESRAAEICAEALAVDGPVAYGPGTDRPIRERLVEQFGVMSHIIVAVYPKVGKPWLFGMHQCAYTRIWTEGEQQLFQEIGRRVGDALSTFLVLRDLRQSEERFELAVQGSRDGLWDWPDMSRDEQWWSPQAYELLGYRPGEIEPSMEAWQALIHPDDREIVSPALHAYLTGHERPFDVEYRLQHKSGEYRWVRMRGQPSVNESGQVRRMSGSVRDVTERRRAQDALRESEQSYRRLVENSPLGILSADLQGRIVEVNPALLKMLGSPSAEATKQINVLTFPLLVEAGIAADVQRCIESGGAVISERQYTSKWGKSVDVRLHLTPILDGDGRVAMVQLMAEDITERKRAVEALRESESRYRALFEHASDAYFVENYKDEIVDVNRSACEMLGYTREELLRMKVTDIQAPEVRGQEGTVIKNEMEEYYGVPFESLDIHRDGTRIPVEVTISQMPGGEGGLYLSVVRDITERKRAEMELLESKERYQGLFEGVPVGLFRSTQEGKILEANSALVEMLGYPDLESLLAVNARELYVEPVVRDAWAVRLQQEGEVQRSTAQLRRFDGSVIDMRGSSRVVRDDRDRILYLEGTLEDITETRRAEQEREQLWVQLQEQAQQVQDIITTVPDGVLLLDNDARVLQANPAARRILDFLAGIQIGDRLTHLGSHPIAELLTFPPQQGLWHELIWDGPPRRIFELVARPTATLPREAEAELQTEGWVLVIREATQEREIQERVHQQERLATVGQLAAGIAHDFNNIMAVIVLYAQMTLRTPDLSAKTYQRLETIVQQAKGATNLIQQILDFSRRSILERQPLNLLPFLKELVKLLQRTLPENIEVELRFGQDDYTVNADPTRIQQVFMNLAVNARDAMQAGGGTLSIALEYIPAGDYESELLTELGPGDWVRITVEDNGVGIPAKALPHVFEPFFTTKEPGKGSGLGLAQVYGIISQHGGRIEASSQVGKGTVFTLYLPALSVHVEGMPSHQPAELAEGHGETVLVVEDDAITREAVMDVLGSLGYRVVQAADGSEALAVFERCEEPIRLVISDLVMPVMSGQAMLEALWQQNPSVKAIIMTGHPLEEEIGTLRTKGQVVLLQKPLDLNLLAEAVGRAME